MHETAQAFGYPRTLIADSAHWMVLMRPAQVTVGALVLTARDDVRALSDLSPAACTELHTVIGAIERTLAGLFEYRKINYLCLMMRDPQVHFHVLPRYDGPRDVAGTRFTDAGWPGQPDLGSAPELDDAERDRLVSEQ